MPYRLEPDEALAAGLRRLVVEQAAAAAEHLAGDDLRLAVHEARKRSKEARAALRLLHGCLAPATEARVRRALAAAAREIAPARDGASCVASLASLRQHQRLLHRERVPAEEALLARRTAGETALTPQRRAEVADELVAAAEALPAITYMAADDLARSLRRVYRRGLRSMREAVDGGGTEAWHEWRHDAKELWYAVRVLEESWPGPLGALADELRLLSQALGDEHDLTVLHDVLVEAGGEPPLLTPRLDRAIERRKLKLRAASRELGQRLWAEDADAFAERLAGYWQRWHSQAGG